MHLVPWSISADYLALSGVGNSAIKTAGAGWVYIGEGENPVRRGEIDWEWIKFSPKIGHARTAGVLHAVGLSGHPDESDDKILTNAGDAGGVGPAG
jgi:hypothetical protein